MRFARMVIRCAPTGVFFRTAALVHNRSTSGGEVPGHCMVMGDRSGEVAGGTTTHALPLAGDRVPSVPRSWSSPDHATARYQTRCHDPDGVSVPVAWTIVVPSPSVDLSTCQA